MKSKVSFPNITTTYSAFKKESRGLTVDEYYSRVINASLEEYEGNIMQAYFRNFTAEHLWYQSQQPYYKLYPSVMGVFMETNCDVSAENIRMPHGCFAIKLPLDKTFIELEQKNIPPVPQFFFVSSGLEYSYIKGLEQEYCFIPGHFDFEYDDEGYEKVCDFLLNTGHVKNRDSILLKSIKRTVTVSLNFHNQILNEIGHTATKLSIDDDIEQTIKSISNKDMGLSKCLRVALGVIFCATGSHKVLEYDVLSKHIEAYRKLKDDNKKERKSYEGKARKKGKHGWCIGRDGRELGLPNGILKPQNEGQGKREVSHSFIRGAHWRQQAYGSKWSKKKVILIPNTQVRPDLPPIDYAA